MKTQAHRLLPASSGTTHQFDSLHFGDASAGRKVYLQAGLHADEIPAMLVACLLKERLQALENSGRLQAEVVLVTTANPIGLGQFVLGNMIGRFELTTGRNFNRGFPLLHEKIAEAIKDDLTDDAGHNARIIRTAWGNALRASAPRTEFESLQRALMLLSHDADVVIDLHCSKEATLHVYTGETIWSEVEPLARYLGARASLLAIDAGGESFDEAHSLTWWHLQQRFGQNYPVPNGSVAVTIEHRGQRDVSYELAETDATAILNYLTHLGAVSGGAPALPPLHRPATPLAGSEQFYAPMSGIVVYRAQIGAVIEAGQAVFDIVDPATAARVTLHSSNEGVFYMAREIRFAKQGDALGRVSGAKVIRTGPLLSA